MNGWEYLLLLFLLWPVIGMFYYLSCYKHRRDNSLSRNSLNSSNHKTEVVTVRRSEDFVDVNVDIETSDTNPIHPASEQAEPKGEGTNIEFKYGKPVKNIKV